MATRYPGEGAGKGDKSRVANKKAYDETWERVFGKRKDKDNGKEKRESGTDDHSGKS